VAASCGYRVQLCAGFGPRVVAQQALCVQRVLLRVRTWQRCVRGVCCGTRIVVKSRDWVLQAHCSPALLACLVMGPSVAGVCRTLVATCVSWHCQCGCFTGCTVPAMHTVCFCWASRAGPCLMVSLQGVSESAEQAATFIIVWLCQEGVSLCQHSWLSHSMMCQPRQARKTSLLPVTTAHPQDLHSCRALPPSMAVPRAGVHHGSCHTGGIIHKIHAHHHAMFVSDGH
jgi:hypothetical protein